MPGLKLEAVVVTYNSADHVRPCLSSLERSGAAIVVVDNGSRDETLSIIRSEFPQVQLILASENPGYGTALNLGIARTNAPFVLAANPDTVFPEGELHALTQFLAEHSRVGVVGPQQVFPDGSWQRSYGDVPGIYDSAKTLMGLTSLWQWVQRLRWRYMPTRLAKEVGYVDGAVMMIRRAAFDQISGFDENFHYYCEDADLCVRLRAMGWGVVTVPSVSVVHLRGGCSTRVEGYSDKILRAQIAAKCQLVTKHNRSWHFRLLRWLCLLEAWKILLIYRLLKVLTPRSYSRRAATMELVYRREAQLWRSVPEIKFFNKSIEKKAEIES